MAKREKAEKGDARLDAMLAEISKDLKCTISTIRNHPIEAVERISSGSMCLDLAMGGGWARGRIHEVYGPEQSGKTSLALFAIAQAQKQGLNAAFLDVEHTFDPTFAQKLGVDTQSLAISQPDYGEQCLQLLQKLVATNKFGIIAIDSIAGLIPKKELEGDIGDNHMGLQARMLGQAIRMLVPSVHSSGTAVIFINQLRMKLGVMFSNPETTPGGLALKFFSTIRLDARRASNTESPSVEDPVTKYALGHGIRVKVVKNKIFPAYRKAIVPILYDSGIRYAEDIASALIITGIAKAERGGFSWTDVNIMPKNLVDINTWEMLYSSLVDQTNRDAICSLIRNTITQQSPSMPLAEKDEAPDYEKAEKETIESK